MTILASPCLTRPPGLPKRPPLNSLVTELVEAPALEQSVAEFVEAPGYS